MSPKRLKVLLASVLHHENETAKSTSQSAAGGERFDGSRCAFEGLKLAGPNDESEGLLSARPATQEEPLRSIMQGGFYLERRTNDEPEKNKLEVLFALGTALRRTIHSLKK
jgi:hypothetical protein